MINLPSVLTLLPNDYQNLATGAKIVLLCRPYLVGQHFIILPQAQEKIASKHFIEIVANYAIKDDKSKKYIFEKYNISDVDIEACRQNFENDYVSLLTVRAYTFDFELEIQPSQYLGHSALPKAISITNYRPVLDDYNFEQRRQNPHKSIDPLAKLFPDLQFLALSDTRVDSFITTLQAHQQSKPRPRPSIPDWIANQDIINLGEWSKNEENAKQESAHAHGTRFEEIVRKALGYLGFTIAEAHKGGPGGLDFLISKPYPIIGECKSGKSIPKDTPNQLIRLGITKLGTDWLTKAVKLIIASGAPTDDVSTFAQQSDTCIMNHHTLQKLVSLHAQYPNAINLRELKEYLVADNAEEKIDQYLAKIQEAIATRAFIIKLVRTLHLRQRRRYISLEAIKTGYDLYKKEPPLNRSQLLSILIELSSPLTGYLGRHPDPERQYQDFYYCHDLAAPKPLTDAPTENTTPP